MLHQNARKCLNNCQSLSVLKEIEPDLGDEKNHLVEPESTSTDIQLTRKENHMAKKPSITIFKHGDRYVLNIPAAISPQGKRQRLFFETKRKAEMHREGLSRQYADYGRESLAIKPALAEDATKAAAILEQYHVTLTEAAKFFAEHRKRQGASIPFAELWERHLEALSARSDAHLRKLELLGRKIIPVIGKKLVCDIGHRELADLLAKKYPTAYGFNLAVRNISSAFNRAVREGWTPENICKRIEKRDTGRHEVRFLSIQQCCDVLKSCRDFRQDKSIPDYLRRDCRDCVAAVALMLFGGVRPNEVARLTWEQIDTDEGTVYVPNKKAKTDRSRYFEMSETLKVWLDTVPAGGRIESVVPGGWEKKWQLIRRHAGISDMNDALRKSYITYALAATDDVNKVRAVVGHEVGDTLFRFYRGAVSRSQGRKFFEILPEDSQGKIVKMEIAK